jgi:hypothetical protein
MYVAMDAAKKAAAKVSKPAAATAIHAAAFAKRQAKEAGDAAAVFITKVGTYSAALVANEAAASAKITAIKAKCCTIPAIGLVTRILKVLDKAVDFYVKDLEAAAD